ncbi:DUF5996 family protein [Microbulbifer sp. TYP-18]|uniref:DUF5996 family protein n=1 Tax=Microbulbifer sp. TYP-18 TaxID=3230024 RepID=UPI0034C5BB26
MSLPNRSHTADWPDLSLKSGSDTAATLHMLTQIVGKIRLAQTPWTNHSWHVPLYMTARGLSSSLVPYDGKAFEVNFNLLDHLLVIQTTDGGQESIALEPRPVCDFYGDIVGVLEKLGLDIKIFTVPSEVSDGIPFEKDTKHCHYDREFATRFWRALVQIDRVFKEFRAHFMGKCSPIHFFWGSFDLAVTRFSGKEAPVHPGHVAHCPDWVAQEAYSHEVSSAGFWLGGGPIKGPSFYSYAYPTREEFPKAKVAPPEAYYSNEVGEFILSYEDVRTAASPDEMLLEFLQSTYEAAADSLGWDRSSLECKLVPSR